MGDFKNEEILVMARDDFEMEGGGIPLYGLWL